MKNSILIDDDVDEINRVRSIREKIANDNVQNIVILTTTDCNARCYYCFERGIKPEKMSFGTADALVDYCGKKYHDKKLLVSWFGGEPLLNYEIIEYITDKLIAKGYELSGYVTTNGSLLTPGMLLFFTERYANMTFQITLDALGDEYGKIKNYVDVPSSLAFNRTVENIKTILASKCKLLLRINFLTSQIDTALKTYDEVIDLFRGYDLSETNIFNLHFVFFEIFSV